MLIVIGLVLFVFVVAAFYAVRVYPICGGLSIGCLTSILYHVVTESTVTTSIDFVLHDHHEAENRFWSFVVFVFSCAMIFGELPISFGSNNPLLGIVTAVMVSTYTYGIQRDMTRERLKRSAKLAKSWSWASQLNMGLALEKLKSIERDLNIIDVPSVAMKWFPSRKRAILKAEERVIKTFRDASNEELNFIVTRTQLALIFYKIKDLDVMRIPMQMRRSSDMHRTKLLELLTVDRVNDLGVRSKVAVLDAMQKMRVNAHPRGEEFVRSVLLSTKGHDLTKLKCFMDSKGTFHNLHKLIFSDVKSEETRMNILAHIYDQGTCVKRTSLRTRLRKRRLRKVLSDVDDTLFSSGGRYPAGCDRSYPRKALYPGVLAFYEELDTQGSAPVVRFTHNKMATESNLTFLSARPHVYKDTSESVSYRKFASLRKHRGMHTEPTLLAGALDSGFKMFTGDFGPLAEKKVLNFTQYAAMYPEFEFVFIGDNGQGDVLTAESMMKSNISDRIEAVFIHLVKPLDRTPGARTGRSTSSTPVTSPVLRSAPPPLRIPEPATPLDVEVQDEEGNKKPVVIDEEKKGARSEDDSVRLNVDAVSRPRAATSDHDGAARWKRMGMVFFRTYVGAARRAAELGKITFDGACRVARCAIRDFYILDDEDAWVGGLAGHQREAARLELNRDIYDFNEFAMSLPTVTRAAYKALPFITCSFVPMFPPGDDVQTTWGVGQVVGRRAYDAMYEVRLSRWRLANGICPRVFCPVTSLRWPRPCEVGDRVRCEPGGIGRITDFRFRDGVYTVKVHKNRSLYVHHSAIKSRVRAVLGDIVRVAPYGLGIVTGWRHDDQMYEIALYWRNAPGKRPVMYTTGQSMSLVAPGKVPTALMKTKSALYRTDEESASSYSAVFCSWRR